MTRPHRLVVLVLLIGLVGSGIAPFVGVAAADGDLTNTTDVRKADLQVEQVYHVDSRVDRSTSDGEIVYSVRGPQFWLRPQNFDASNIQKSGVRGETNATLRYDKAAKEWVFNPRGTSGTFTVFWVVQEQTAPSKRLVVANTTEGMLWLTQQPPSELTQLQVDSVYRYANRTNVESLSDAEAKQLTDWQNWEKFGTVPRWQKNESVAPPIGEWKKRPSDPATIRRVESQVGRVVYEAKLQVSGASMVHISKESYQETREKANLWEENVVEPLSDYVPVEKIPERLEVGIAWIKFTEDPTRAFRSSLLVIFFSFWTPGGLFWLAVLSGLPLVMLIREIAKRYAAEEKLGDVDDIEQRQAELDAAESAIMLSQEDYTESPGLPEKFAHPLRQNAGEDIWTGANTLAATLSPPHLKQVLLAGLRADETEWYARVERDEHGAIESVGTTSTKPTTDGGAVPDDGDIEYIPIGDCSSDIYGAMNLGSIDTSPLRKGVDINDLPNVPGSECSTLEEVMQYQVDQAGIDLENEFDDSLQAWGRAVADVMGYVASSDYTGPDGSEHPVMRGIEALFQLFSVASEQYEAQYFRRYQLVMLHAAEALDDTQRITNNIETYRRNGSPSETHSAGDAESMADIDISGTSFNPWGDDDGAATSPGGDD